jgi:transposase-like protein
VLGRVFDTLAAASADERATLSAQKAKLEAEQVKLLQAHYADAIPIDLLKTEQDRIRASLHAINSRLDSLGTLYTNAKIGLNAILDILTDLGDLYAKAEPAERRMLNRALFTKITIDDAEHVTTEPVQTIATILSTDTSPNNVRTLPHDEAGQGSNVTGYVGAMEHCGNRRPRVERLVSAWNQGTRGDTDPEGETDDPLIDASVEPKQRPRTRLTDEEVDAMRTARAQGISVIALAKQFGVHRGTVWAKSR